MARLKVRVTKIEARRGQSGTYAIAHLAGGKRAYVWDRALAEALATPGLYELETQVRQGFLRIVAARPIASSNGPRGHEERPEEASTTPGSTQGHEERPVEASTAPWPSQERLEALKLAVALAPHFGYTDVSQVLTVAEKMLRWLRKEG
jgi:hypothetical protein